MMKKNFKRLMACMFLACATSILPSCQSASQGLQTAMNVLSDQQTQQLLSALVTNLVGQRGANYAYNGKGTAQLLALKEGGQAFQDYVEATKKADFSGICNLTVNNTAANVILPDMSVGEGRMKNLHIYNMVMETASAGTKLSIGDKSTIDGTFLIGDKELKPTNLYIDALVTNQKLTVTLMSIYFGDNGEQVVNLTFEGQTTVQQ